MPPIHNIDILTPAQQQYVIDHSKGMEEFGWQSVEIAWYSDGSRNMIVTMQDGQIHSQSIN